MSWGTVFCSLIAGTLGGLGAWVVASMMVERDNRLLRDIAIMEEQMLQQADTISVLREEVERLEQRVNSRIPGGTEDVARDEPLAPLPPLLSGGQETLTDYTGLTLLQARRRTNAGLSPVGQRRLIEVFGMPAPELDNQNCATEITPKLRAHMSLRDVGPFRARLLTPALADVELVLSRIKETYPNLYAQLKSYGGFCARFIRGSTSRVSRHAYGLAIDISIGGTLDQMGDGHTQFGLLILADHFREVGWLWGAAFSREDSMHFEVSSERFESWISDGLL